MRRLPSLDEVVDLAIALGLAVLLAVGFASSYTTLLDLAVEVGEYPAWLAPAVPLAFDLGIVVLSLKVVRAAREGKTAPLLRLLVVALSILTVAANAASASTWAGALLHAVPPAMFVISFESVISSTRRHALERLGLVPPPLPRVRGVRWVLALRSTFRDWRAAVLARDLFEHDQAGQDPNGQGGAPSALTAPAPVEAETDEPAPVEARPATRRASASRRRSSTRAEVSTAVDVAAIAVELHRAGHLSRRALTRAVRDAGGSIGTDRADEVIREVTRPVPITPVPTPVEATP